MYIAHRIAHLAELFVVPQCKDQHEYMSAKQAHVLVQVDHFQIVPGPKERKKDGKSQIGARELYPPQCETCHHGTRQGNQKPDASNVHHVVGDGLEFRR